MGLSELMNGQQAPQQQQSVQSQAAPQQTWQPTQSQQQVNVLEWGQQNQYTQQPQSPQQTWQPTQQQAYNQPPNQTYNQPQSQSPPSQQPYTQSQLQQPTQPQNQSGVRLKKGQKTNLSQMAGAGNLTNIDVAIGWDVGANTNYDLDVVAFLVDNREKVIGDEWFVYYNQPISPDGSIRHSGDNKTGNGNGDDEIISINLPQVHTNISKIIFCVTIYDAKARSHNFGKVQNAYVRVINKSTGAELIRFNLDEYYSNVYSMVLGELYKHNNDWKFNPIGNGKELELLDLCGFYGVNVID